MQTLTLKTDGVYIDSEDEFNFLGFTLDNNINWRKHMEKCPKTIDILNRLKQCFIIINKCITYKFITVIVS